MFVFVENKQSHRVTTDHIQAAARTWAAQWGCSQAAQEHNQAEQEHIQVEQEQIQAEQGRNQVEQAHIQAEEHIQAEREHS